jgi:hypothetical protein
MKVPIEKFIKGQRVVEHKREYDLEDGDISSVWDYYTLEDGKRCIFRNGFFWEWLD